MLFQQRTAMWGRVIYSFSEPVRMEWAIFGSFLVVIKLLKSKSGYEDFFSLRFGQGVSFKLPLTVTYYKEIKKASAHLFLDTLSFFSEVWLTPVSITISRDEEASLNEFKPGNPLKINLNLNDKTRSLYYKNLVKFQI